MMVSQDQCKMAWRFLDEARRSRSLASSSSSHHEAEAHLNHMREYVRMARTWNHWSIQDRPRNRVVVPPPLRIISRR